MGRKAYSTQDAKTGKASKPKPEVRVRKWVSKKVIARLHNVCERTVLTWMIDGIIPYRKLPSGTMKFNPLAVEIALSIWSSTRRNKEPRRKQRGIGEIASCAQRAPGQASCPGQQRKAPSLRERRLPTARRKRRGIYPERLKKVKARYRGLRVEPLWGPIIPNLDGIDWCIVGGESGPSAQPFDLDWARTLRTQCSRSGTAFFVKQLGAAPIENGKPLDLIDGHGGNWTEWPVDLQLRAIPDGFY